MTRWSAIIPLRAGSKGLANKNIRPLAGKPLYQHSLDIARAAGASHSYISTDIEALLQADFPPDITLHQRPAALASDESPMDAVLLDLLANPSITGTLMLLQATSPLRNIDDINQALALFARGTFDLVLSTTPTDASILKYGMQQEGRFVPVSKPHYCFTNRQDLPPIYRPNGAIFVFDADWFRQNGQLATDNIGMIEMPPERSDDIDTLADFEVIEARLNP